MDSVVGSTVVGSVKDTTKSKSQFTSNANESAKSKSRFDDSDNKS